ncbi:IclR family transcriptional regulator [Streptomyces alkaliterrae]|uniref:Helix-turn-helix domain-containing protein n=1 Tax=Streptomyces alkaliterrae TaxID=2213162 RepID=A0A5P0YKU3_9ACTN|nr:IclR family transcriptional regulator C-terminal domain-containing protein [Streptomyces alkaliterrae]MBB1252732.1 helix-turn-helix domain-containing protein [Streptomyces alkaliterrae]MBB1259499.1 helix-turn-helix domain-containing protein [Streptomyces alkaliterrae]MQS00935.1 helix-turn-helix domain-containing protein [Streptomyces alkaliterrae]
MTPKPVPAVPFQSVQYALRVLESVARRSDGLTEDQLARETGLPPGHLAHLLVMLTRESYLDRLADGSYVAGESFRLLEPATDRRAQIGERLQRTLTSLRDEIGAAVYVSRYVDGEVKITQFADGPQTPAVNEWVDFRAAAHASAVGKCLLTQLDHDGRRDHLSRHRTIRLTSRTTTSERVLFSQLDSQPPTVPVLDLQEYAVGTVCAAVPVTAGSAVGCLALSLPIQHAHRLRSAARKLNEQAAPVLLSLSI